MVKQMPHCRDSSYARKWKEIHLSVPANRIRVLVKSVRRRAKGSNLAFDEALLSFVNSPPTRCLCCRIELDYATLCRSRHNRAPSLDRLVCSEGYTVDNTRIICTRCNYLKNNASLNDLRRFVAYVASRGTKI